MDCKSLATSVPVILLLILVNNGPGSAAESPDNIQHRVIRLLSDYHTPNSSGAIGRNKAGWIHARFQSGMHHLVRHAVLRNSNQSLVLFIQSLERSLDTQGSDGHLALIIPEKLVHFNPPHEIDLISGTAFFLSSAGSGLIYARRGNDIIPAYLQERLEVSTRALMTSARWLLERSDYLFSADSASPNRLLISALAFRCMAELGGDHDDYMSLSYQFRDQALSLQSTEGYFVEAGGFDSSYNAVALSAALRLVICGDDDPNLLTSIERALTWQLNRIDSEGNVDLSGNTRVRASGGETFMGNPKGLDLVNLIECLSLAHDMFPGSGFIETADLILTAYNAYP